MALLAVLGVCTYGFILKGSDTIFPNVYVAGVNVGGLKRDAAINAVKLAVEQETAADTLTVVLPDRTIEFTPEVTNVALNPDEAADAAMNYGRDGGPIKALITYQKAKKDRQDIALESGKNLDTTYIRDLIDQTARACASEKIDPIVTVDADAKTVTVVTGSPKISLDADKLYDEVVARFESGDFSDLKFDYDTEPCAPVDLQTYYDQFATEMKDAYYDEEKKELVAEKVGFGFDVSYYTQQIAMADAGTTITIQAEEMQPEVTLADLEKEYFADVLGSCDSPHTAQAGRTKNLELACKAIDGTILNPGDEFSFNKIVGERTAEKGYQKAIVYQTGGKSEAEEGGGVCQVASTIYTACLYADLKVTERAPHMFTVTYVQLGMDATIYWGSLDYKFVNSTDHPLRIDASVSGGYVHIKLMGTTPKDKSYDHIVLHNEVIATRQPKTVIDGTETEITDAGTGVDENGNTVTLTHGNFGVYRESGDQRVRRESFEAYFGEFKRYINTFAAMYAGSVKMDNYYTRVRGYGSTCQRALFADNVPVSVYDQLTEAVHAGLPTMRRYLDLRRRVLGLDELNMYDLYCPMVADVDMKMPYGEAQKLVLEATKPLGEEYGKLLQRAFSERWIDVYENKGKTTGAFSCGVYGVHPFVLLNYSDKLDDAFTLAHELGHSMHSWFSDTTQDFANHDYRIMVAEVASTVN